MRLRISVALAGALAALLASTAGATGLPNLQPGVRTADLRERVPVNVVFVGFEPAQVAEATFTACRSATSRSSARGSAYGVVSRSGIDYTYDYDVTYASTAWENSFFAALAGLADAGPRTAFQDEYNSQAGVRDVGQNHFIDAPTVEKWLIDNAPAGVNTRENTIFFVNWWGRPDFKDHVYTKFGEPDPDTGYDFGVEPGEPQDHRVGRHDARRRGDGPRRARRPPRLVPRPLRRARILGRELRHHERRPRRRRRGRLPASRSLGVRRRRLSESGHCSRATSSFARYAPINLMFTSSPLYPP